MGRVFLSANTALRLAALAVLITAGFAAFAVLVMALGVVNWRELRGRFRRLPA